jgi:SAM-dependent methyltransferase
MIESKQPASMAGVATHELVFELVKDHLTRPSLVVDLAAGQGAFSIKLRELGHEVVAVDTDPTNWAVPDMDLRVQDLDCEFADRITTENVKVDAIVAIEIIEHLENPFQFARECAKLLKPGGILFLTTPNVEAVHSRLIYLYTGRLSSFAEDATIRLAHITPIFKWKLDMLLEEAGFDTIHEEFEEQLIDEKANLRFRLSAKLARMIEPIVKGAKGGRGRIIVARLR